MIQEDVFQRLKEQLIGFGKRTGLIVESSLMKRSIQAIIRDIYQEMHDIEMPKEIGDIPDELVEEMTNRFIVEMDYVKYYSTGAHVSRKDQDVVYYAAKELVKQGVCKNTIMIRFKDRLYVDKLIAVMIKLNS